MNDLGGHTGDADEFAPAACLARARNLIPLLRSAAGRIDAERELPADVLDAMHEARLFKLLLPRSYGGGELRPVDYIKCVEAVAEGDASAAWCMNQGSGCSMASAYVSPTVATEVWGHDRDVLAWGQGPGAKAIRTEGGWTVTGTWSFASGSRHATWLGAQCPCVEADGSPIKHAGGEVWSRTFLFPRGQAKIDDVWQVMGLRGTGSDNYTIKDLFVDDAHAMTREFEPERCQPGSLYSFQAMQLYAGGFASVALGVSRAMLDSAIELVKTKSQAWSADKLRDNHAVQYIIAYADAAWKAARARLHQVFEEAWDDVITTGVLSLDHKIEIRQAATYAIHVAREVCHQIYHEAGSTAIFDNMPFERRLRDMNAVSQQTQGRRTHLETVGCYMLGGSPEMRWL
jgi:indole-3-acetate monooxygenase